MTQPAQHPDCPHCARIEALAADTARRLKATETLLRIAEECMVTDSLLLGTEMTHLPEPGEIDAATRQSDQKALFALAERLWPEREYLDITAEGGTP